MEDDRPVTRGYVVHPDIRTDPDRHAPGPALDEAVSLAVALPDLEVAGSEIVPLNKVHPGTLFGSGKIEELKARIKAADAGLVMVDGPVTPVQQRNLERALETKLLDRTGLILEIFSDRARTREGVLQVEMAHLSYQRTRLVRAWTHLERQRGGLGFVGGPGETQIEADRRAIDDQLNRLRKQLDKVVKTRKLHRAARAKVPFPIVALVGYTNAGKSTLFNRLTGAQVMAEDMLFATLDPTMRKVTLDTGDEVILSDTVGFISDLPTQLVAAFRATLEEVLEADVILHVRDISHPETESQRAEVMAILADMGVTEATPLIEVWNKGDLLDPEEATALEARAQRDADIFVTSAVTGQGLRPMLERVSERLSAPRSAANLVLPYSAARKRAWLHEEGIVEAETTDDAGYHLRVNWTERQKARFERL
ncbi:MAG: GTPase HflX [Salibaculum sp.]|uniref:GTPase HflX n=1 Tax=Roseovarius halophilus (ex Wu et al. 2025) TaxID=3376060 RepID=UPI0028704144|nr:GTPase HflX [Salibaculum sp.]MDR9427364.1 GTPase HflX [Salibaculum sp.]MDR9482444.1 GTPase HflX [Salibaculum sp.]